ncbi:hypothetical protein ACFQ1Q_04870 [Winogradskyella litorisediminis]|uniref:Uncharacterized protein n=1 Tax=Winogradskyella litorisediminis TaxID=1156618 RepID=A0ABW3N7Z4_9FLAO
MKYLLALVICIALLSCNDKKDANTNTEIIKTQPDAPKSAENLINWKEKWTVGQGSADGFKSFGNENESRRIKGLDIDSKEAILWECVADTSTSWDGGFLSKVEEIDSTMPYMFVAWVKKTNGNSARVYYAFDSVNEVTGEPVKNANFIGAGSKLTNLESWYTLVGYIYPSDHQDNIEAKIYSGLYFNGEKVQEGRDFKWEKGATSSNIRIVQVESQTDGENLLIWNPQLYKVDGTEPKLYNLL